MGQKYWQVTALNQIYTHFLKKIDEVIFGKYSIFLKILLASAQNSALLPLICLSQWIFRLDIQQIIIKFQQSLNDSHSFLFVYFSSFSFSVLFFSETNGLPLHHNFIIIIICLFFIDLRVQCVLYTNLYWSFSSIIIPILYSLLLTLLVVTAFENFFQLNFYYIMRHNFYYGYKCVSYRYIQCHDFFLFYFSVHTFIFVKLFK